VIVLDTNVLSELVRPAPSKKVIDWLAAQEPSSIFATTISEAEILYGVERLPPGKRRSALEIAVQAIFEEDFSGRVLPFDEDAARLLPKLVVSRDRMGRPMAQFDALIAAIARARRGVLATRNVSDFDHCGLRIINPWSE
jgi:toxin FitB